MDRTTEPNCFQRGSEVQFEPADPGNRYGRGPWDRPEFLGIPRSSQELNEFLGIPRNSLEFLSSLVGLI